MDAVTGKLEPSGHVVAQDSPTWLEVDPSGDFLVATHELSHHTGVPPGTGFLSSYKIDHDSGELNHVCTAPTNGRGNTCVTFNRTGRWLLVTRYWEGKGISCMLARPRVSALVVLGAKCVRPWIRPRTYCIHILIQLYV